MSKLISLLLLSALLLCGCTSSQQVEPALRDTVKVSFDTALVERGDVVRLTQLEAFVVPEVFDIAFEEASGNFWRLYVAEGDSINAGDPIAALDTTNIDQQISAAESNINRLKTNLKNATRRKDIEIELLSLDLADARDASDTSSVELLTIKIDSAKLERERLEQSADIEIKQAESSLVELHERRDASFVYADVSGVVVYTASLIQGNWVPRGTVAAKIATDEVFIQYDGIDKSYGSLDGKEVTAYIDGETYVVEPVVYGEREYLEMVLAGDEPPPRFRFVEQPPDNAAGSFAAVTIQNSVARGVLRIPSGALYSGDDVNYVYLIENGEKIYTEVKYGVVNAAWVEILSGLEEGDVVGVKQ